MNEKKYWLWLTMVFGIGSSRIWQVMCLYEKASDAYNSLKNDHSRFELSEKESNNIKSIPIEKAEEVIVNCDKKGIGLLCYSDEDYPSRLRHICTPPAVLYYVGSTACLRNRRTVTAVGTRRVSQYGAMTAGRICRELAERGVLIVSGFAMGTDITAHLAAVKLGKPTVAVLGCGVDVDYPKGHLGYKRSIINSGGLLVSEYPPGTPPHGYNFPKRNRILAALGRVAVVFEASVNSGSLITAAIAANQGRDVFVLPPADIFSGSFSGNSELLRDGAIPLLSSEDIFDCFRAGSAVDMEIRAEVYSGIGDFLSEDKDAEDTSALRSEKYIRSEKLPEAEEAPVEEEPAVSDGEAEVTEENTGFDSSELTELQSRIIRLLEKGRLHADVLAIRADLELSELMTELTELEILGAVRSLPGKMYEISK